EIEQVATHVGIMSAGRLLRQGRLEDVLGGASTSLRVSTPDATLAITVLERLGLTAKATHADLVTATSGDLAPEVVNAELVGAGVRVRGFAVERPALDDLFVQLTGEGFNVVR
ncbi:MAG: type transport system ATP-binding protein, partial [Frankiaceae bacterium]|nr:type transport system ATP-binding protein [Frankiaceae bacterium]